MQEILRGCLRHTKHTPHCAKAGLRQRVICFQKWGNEVLVRKSKFEARSVHELQGVGAKPLVEVQGAKPLEAPGFYSIFNALYCLNLFYFTHSSYKFSLIGKKVTWATLTLLIKKWDPGGEAPVSSKGLQHFQCKTSA